MKSIRKSSAISICATLIILLISAIPLPASAAERQYAELGKTYTIQGGWGSGYLIFEKYVLVNASDNVSVNWKTGTKGSMSNYWELSINTYSPALNWSYNMTENNVVYQFLSFQGGPPLSLWVRPSVDVMVEIRVVTFGNFADQTLNVTVNRTPAAGGDLQKQINDLKAQMNALSGIVTLLNSTVNAMVKQITNLSTNLMVLESTVGNNTKDIKDLQNQLVVLWALYNELTKNMTEVQNFINDLNVTGHNVTVVYQNITRLYNNITNLTKFTTENVTKTIMMYQNTTKTVNAYDNKTLGALAKNITKVSEEVAGLTKDLNKTASGTDLKDLRGEVNGLKNTTAKKSDLASTSQQAVIASAVTMMITLAAAGVLYITNKRKINKHDEAIALLMDATKPIPKPEVKKAGAKKVDKEDKF